MKKKKIKNKILLFSITFVFTITIDVLLYHSFSSKGIGPLSWIEIKQNWLIIVISSILISLSFTYAAYDDIFKN